MDAIPRLYCRPGGFRSLLLAKCPSVRKSYHPPFWCVSGAVHSIGRVILKSCPEFPWKREIFQLSDGGTVALDWLMNEKSINEKSTNEKSINEKSINEKSTNEKSINENSFNEKSNSGTGHTLPIVLILPGLTGSTIESYLLHVVKALHKTGITCVVFNNRGRGGNPLLTSQTYSAAYTDDLRHVISHVHQKISNAKKILAIGFSMGGMILFNYLAKCGENGQNSGLVAAMTICSPWDPHNSTRSLESFPYRQIFNSRLAKNLCKGIEKQRPIFDEYGLDVDHVLKSRLIREFDERFIVRMFGYRDVNEYYDDAAFNVEKVRRIPIPLLCLNAADDCFAPIESVPFEEVQRSENVAVLVTAHGGHLGYLKAAKHWLWDDDGFIEELVMQFATVIFEEE